MPNDHDGGRLREELLERFRTFARRMLVLAEELDRQHVWRRVVDQVVGAGTSPGAQVHEAQEAMSRADFTKSLGIAAKELNEVRYWLLLIGDMQWVAQPRLDALLDEAEQLRRIVRTIIIRTKHNG